MEFLIESFLSVDVITWCKYILMWIIGGILIFLAIKKEMEPALLLPMGFGCILVNIPLTNVLDIVEYVCHDCGAQLGALTDICSCGGIAEKM